MDYQKTNHLLSKYLHQNVPQKYLIYARLLHRKPLLLSFYDYINIDIYLYRYYIHTHGIYIYIIIYIYIYIIYIYIYIYIYTLVQPAYYFGQIKNNHCKLFLLI